ncbi:hypothetical protein C8Q76DRAFT_789270 [Earliella scabrosa]|nr:hypothetical protein C8Q76DRAFT_789270 [Earliella scabrosa]
MSCHRPLVSPAWISNTPRTYRVTHTDSTIALAVRHPKLPTGPAGQVPSLDVPRNGANDVPMSLYLVSVESTHPARKLQRRSRPLGHVMRMLEYHISTVSSSALKIQVATEVVEHLFPRLLPGDDPADIERAPNVMMHTLVQDIRDDLVEFEPLLATLQEGEETGDSPGNTPSEETQQGDGNPMTRRERPASSPERDRPIKTSRVLHYTEASERRRGNHRRQRRREDVAKKIASGQLHLADTVTASTSVGSLPATQTGWAGSDYRRRKHIPEWVDREWEAGTIADRLLGELNFRKIEYDGGPKWFVDRDGRAFAFRTEVPPWMVSAEGPDQLTFLDKFELQCRAYIERCGNRSADDLKANNRGRHWYMVVGIDRQNKLVPQLTQFHLAHEHDTNWLTEVGSPTDQLIKHATVVFETRFPSLAARVRRCEELLKEQGHKHATPPYGLWYNYCINGPQDEVEGVLTRPHVDGKNLALMMCVVFVWGKFRHAEKAWLVLWEAGLIIELRPGCLLFYPSSLFTHFNVNIQDCTVVTTEDGADPTPENSTPIHGVRGRGSVVLFNQATMFQLAELGSTVKQAKERGVRATCDNTAHIDSLPRPL